MPVYTAAEKAAIFQAFPDDLKRVIGEYEPLEAKTIEQLHDMLIDIRRKFDLAPWHTFTKFMKILGSGKRNGYTFERQNLWTVEKAKQSSTYWNKSCQWVAIRLEVGRGSEVGSEQFYVCPSRRIIWSAATEHQVQNVSVPIGNDSSRVPRYVVVPLNFMFEHAAKHLATLGESHGPVDVYYNVTMAPKPEEVKVTKKATTPTQEEQHKAPEKREPDIQQRLGWNLLLQRLQTSSDHEQAFLRETVEASASHESYLETHTVYLRYKTWALGRGYRPVSEHILNATIVLMHPGVLIDRKRIGKRRPTVAYGITWLTDRPKSKPSEEQPSEHVDQPLRDKDQQIQPIPTATQKQATASKEFLWMMFDMACVKLRELGMESTIERWSKQLKSLVGETL